MLARNKDRRCGRQTNRLRITRDVCCPSVERLDLIPSQGCGSIEVMKSNLLNTRDMELILGNLGGHKKIYCRSILLHASRSVKH